MTIVGVVGPSGSGKTSLVERLIPQLVERGLRVGYLKHAHKGFSHDVPGKDSWRARTAGAQVVVLSGGDRYVIDAPDHVDPQALAALVTGCDLVLAEGFSASPWPKILVVHPDLPARDDVAPPVFVKVATDQRCRADDDDVVRLVDELERLVVEAPKQSISLVVDGEWVPLEGFPGAIATSTILGLLSALKGVESDSEEMVITIRRSS